MRRWPGEGTARTALWPWIRRLAALELLGLALLVRADPGDAIRVLAQAPEAPGQAEQRAGLVIDYGGGRLREVCVDLGGAPRTGEELLRLAGVAAVAEYLGGAMICRLDGVGCNFPQERCWCQCQDLGSDCRYWSYNVWRDGRWEYSHLGAQARIVRPGDVDGWAWGSGGVTRGAQPPPRSFEDLCAVAVEPSPGPTVGDPPATLAPGPTVTPHTSPTVRPSPTARPSPTTRPTATARPRSTGPAVVPSPSPSSNIPGSGAGGTDAPPTVAVLPGGATEPPVDVALLNTATAFVATLTALAPGAGGVGDTPQPPLGLPSGAGNDGPVGLASAAETPLVAVRVVVDPPPPSSGGEAAGTALGLGHGLFLVLILVLGAALLWLRRRREV